MEPLALTDPTMYPTDTVLAGVLGKRFALWEAFFEKLHGAEPELAAEWRYYNDGKAWLMKVTRKKKTVVWVGVHEGGFRITAYLTEKAHVAVRESALSEDCKKQFATGQRFGKLIGVTVEFRKKADVKDGLALVGLKISLK